MQRSGHIGAGASEGSSWAVLPGWIVRGQCVRVSAQAVLPGCIAAGASEQGPGLWLHGCRLLWSAVGRQGQCLGEGLAAAAHVSHSLCLAGVECRGLHLLYESGAAATEQVVEGWAFGDRLGVAFGYCPLPGVGDQSCRVGVL